MKRVHWLLGGALIVGGLAGSQLLLRTAGAQDGLPDITGDWDGLLKGKETAFENGTKPVAMKTPCTFAVSMCGTTVFADLTAQGGEPIALTGVHGNGHFWAFNGDADAPVIVTGHVAKNALKFKGMALRGKDNGSSDLTHADAKQVE